MNRFGAQSNATIVAPQLFTVTCLGAPGLSHGPSNVPEEACSTGGAGDGTHFRVRRCSAIAERGATAFRVFHAIVLASLAGILVILRTYVFTGMIMH